MSAEAAPSRALAVLASMAVAVLVVAAALSPTLNAVVIGFGLALGAGIGGVSVAAYQLTRRISVTTLAATLTGALACFGIARWRVSDDPGGEWLVATIYITLLGAILGLLCVIATLLVLRADLPDEQR